MAELRALSCTTTHHPYVAHYGLVVAEQVCTHDVTMPTQTIVSRRARRAAA
jgi:hypothetical protein